MGLFFFLPGDSMVILMPSFFSNLAMNLSLPKGLPILVFNFSFSLFLLSTGSCKHDFQSSISKYSLILFSFTPIIVF
jgi:hypothetical protein